MQKKKASGSQKSLVGTEQDLTRRTFYHFVVIVGKTACSNRFKPRGKYLLLRWDPLRGQECQASSFLRAATDSNLGGNIFFFVGILFEVKSARLLLFCVLPSLL